MDLLVPAFLVFLIHVLHFRRGLFVADEQNDQQDDYERHGEERSYERRLYLHRVGSDADGGPRRLGCLYTVPAHEQTVRVDAVRSARDESAVVVISVDQQRCNGLY